MYPSLGEVQFALPAAPPVRFESFPEIQKDMVILGDIVFGQKAKETVTEILASHAESEVGKLAMLEGNYAIALADHDKKAWYFIPCLLGTIPFYYYRDDTNIVVATRIKSILSLGFPSRMSINFKVACSYIAACKLDFDMDTMFNDIQVVPDGYYLKVDLRAWRTELVKKIGVLDLWNEHAEDRNKGDQTVSQCAEQLWQVLKECTAPFLKRLDITCFGLSSGIDSPGILAAACAIQDDQIQTRSILLQGTTDTDDAKLIKEIVLKFNTLHRTSWLNPCAATEDSLVEALYMLETPTYRPSTLIIEPEFYRLLANEGFRYVVSGLAGDSLFVGSPDAFVAKVWDSLEQRRSTSVILQNVLLLLHYPSILSENAPYIFGSLLDIYVPEMAPKMKAVLFPSHHRGFHQQSPLSTMGNELAHELLRTWRHFGTPLTHTEALTPQALIDLANLMRISYKSSSRHNITLRLPYCSPKMVEFAFGVPYRYKLRGGYAKYILRKALSGHLPRSVVWNRRKTGFWPLLQDWFNGGLRGIIARWLRLPLLDDETVFDVAAIRRIREVVSGGRPLSAKECHRAWRLACLAKFGQIYRADFTS